MLNKILPSFRDNGRETSTIAKSLQNYLEKNFGHSSLINHRNFGISYRKSGEIFSHRANILDSDGNIGERLYKLGFDKARSLINTGKSQAERRKRSKVSLYCAIPMKR